MITEDNWPSMYKIYPFAADIFKTQQKVNFVLNSKMLIFEEHIVPEDINTLCFIGTITFAQVGNEQFFCLFFDGWWTGFFMVFIL